VTGRPSAEATRHLFGRQVAHERDAICVSAGRTAHHLGRDLRATSLPSRLSETSRRFSTTTRPRRIVVDRPALDRPSLPGTVVADVKVLAHERLLIVGSMIARSASLPGAMTPFFG